MKSLSLTERQLLALLGWSLSSGNEMPACLREPIDWPQMRQLAEEQSVTGLVAEVQKKLPEALWPSRRERVWWFGVAAMIAELNRQMNQAIVRLVQVLDAGQIQYFLFKGQSIGACYPQPEMRQAGDVDFYVSAADFQRAKVLIEHELAVRVEGNEQLDKHDQFTYEGIRFEMHYRLETFGTQRHQSAFDQFICQSLNKPVITRQVGEVPVRILPPAEELMVTFKHLFNHLLMEGVGLRQFCDFMMLLRQFPAEANDILKQELQKVGYYEAFLAVGATLVKYLGLPEASFPFVLKDCHYRWSDRLVAVPMSRGNFGKYHRSMNSRWGHRIDTALIAFGHCLRFMPLAPTDILGLLPTRCRIAWRHKR